MIPRPEVNGIKVENGSAHGLGVYNAATPTISLGYTNGCNKMFVCATVVSRNSKETNIAGCIAVSFSEDQVVPVLLVSYDDHRSNGKKKRSPKEPNVANSGKKFNVQYRQEKRQLQRVQLEAYFSKLKTELEADGGVSSEIDEEQQADGNSSSSSHEDEDDVSSTQSDDDEEEEVVEEDSATDTETEDESGQHIGQQQ
jgi:hypothetical protein